MAKVNETPAPSTAPSERQHWAAMGCAEPAPSTAPAEPADVTALRTRITMLEAVVATLVRQRMLDIAAGRVPRMSRDTMLAEWLAGR